jgi:hypothetical protein
MKVCFPWLGGVRHIQFQFQWVGREMDVAWEGDPDRVRGSFYVLSWVVEINRKSAEWMDGRRGVCIGHVAMNNDARWVARWACAGHIDLKLCHDLV